MSDGNGGGSGKGLFHDLLHPFEAIARSRERERRERDQREREQRRARERREKAGQKAEKQTQQQLHRLTWRGTYYVFNDLPTLNAGNIDHLVVGPEGLTIVETKGNRGVVEARPAEKGKLVLTVDGKELHRNLVRQVRAQMWDVCNRAGMKTGPDDTYGMNWLVCFPNGKLGQGIPPELRAHLTTTDDLGMKLRRSGRAMDEEMVESVASAVSKIYERPPSASPVRRSPSDQTPGREGEDK